MSRADPSDRVTILEAIDIFTARRKVREAASAIGFTARACQELAIVASELSTNILKYGVRGELAIRRIATPSPGIELVAEDDGPPLASFDLAVRDGCTDRGPIEPHEVLRRGGLGAGLGAVVRFSHRVEYYAGPRSKAFRVIRYLDHQPNSRPELK